MVLAALESEGGDQRGSSQRACTQHTLSRWHPPWSFSSAQTRPPLASGTVPGRECTGILGFPGLGLESWGLTKHPGVQQFLREHSEAAWERPQAGEGSAQIYPPIAWALATGARSYLPSPGWGVAGVAWPGGREAAWGLDTQQSRQPRAPPGA